MSGDAYQCIGLTCLRPCQGGWPAWSMLPSFHHLLPIAFCSLEVRKLSLDGFVP